MGEQIKTRAHVPGAEDAWLSRATEEARRLDLAVYAAVAATPTPSLDLALSRLTRAADYSRLSIIAAMILALSAGDRGRKAASAGLVSVAVTATTLNLGIKPVVRRRRPDRSEKGIPLARQVRMPSSTSFPSGHSASAFAFSTGAGQVLPSAGLPLRSLAALVAYSRVHTGVHYPADVIAGALIGSVLAQATAGVLERSSRLEGKWARRLSLARNG